MAFKVVPSIGLALQKADSFIIYIIQQCMNSFKGCKHCIFYLIVSDNIESFKSYKISDNLQVA